MNQLEKMNKIYATVEEKIKKEYYNAEEANELVNSDFTEKLTTETELTFPFQYSDDSEGMYFFVNLETFKEYLLERLSNEGIIESEDYYESSEDWEYSSC